MGSSPSAYLCFGVEANAEIHPLIPKRYLAEEDYGPYIREEFDMRVACRVFSEGLKKCERCNGTGNELYFMYKRCEDCGGSGADQDGHSHYVAQVKAA